MRLFAKTCLCLSVLSTAVPRLAGPDTPAVSATASAARVTVGKLERLALAPSKFVEARPVEVWVPDDYAQKMRAGKRFRVLYMHDGQMLFDPSMTWNRTTWHVHETVLPNLRKAKHR